MHKNHVGELGVSERAEIEYRKRKGKSVKENMGKRPLDRFLGPIAIRLLNETAQMRRDGITRLRLIKDDVLSEYSNIIHHIVTGKFDFSNMFEFSILLLRICKLISISYVRCSCPSLHTVWSTKTKMLFLHFNTTQYYSGKLD